MRARLVVNALKKSGVTDRARLREVAKKIRSGNTTLTTAGLNKKQMRAFQAEKVARAETLLRKRARAKRTALQGVRDNALKSRLKNTAKRGR